MTVQFSPKDQDFIQQRGSSAEEVSRQFSYFEKGFDFADLQRAATAGDGIIRLSDSEITRLLNAYPTLLGDKKAVKFVPASGAASRMFKEVFSYLENDDDVTRTKACQLLHSLKDYALYDDLAAAMEKDGLSLDAEIAADHYQTVLSYLLEDKGLNYGKLPKGLLKFHRYADSCRTAMEEHLVEAALYARGNDGICHLHFTVSPQHQPLFEQLLKEVQSRYEARFGVKYDISFSTQAPSTDTLAATEDNQPFRDGDGNLLFRPGGHGALIKNLNAIDADIVFVKNIDNVFYDDTVADTVTYKKVLAAYLLELQKQVFAYVRELETGNLSEEKTAEIQHFVKDKLLQDVRPEREALLGILNRPLRVCGMVKNEGEPGGGPFFVKNKAGHTSLQIVESSQIDKGNPQQAAILQGATHFNPVDMVCCFRDADGRKFELDKFVDPETGFISSKSYEGRTLKAMELPGLWNGAMAHWNTLFIEVPLTTFHPVKTMFDLKK
jgi:hypothetical protein